MNPRLRRWLQLRLDAFERRRDSALTIRAGDPLAAPFASFGNGSWIAHPRVLLQRPDAVSIGDNVEIRSYLCIEIFGPAGKVLLDIGSGCIIGHFVRFVAINGITIEEKVGIGHGCTITDSIHDWQTASPGQPPWDTPLALGQPLRIETGAWIGNNTVVTGGITIGARAIIAPNSVVTRDVPPDTLVSGNPARRVPFPRAGQEAQD